MMDSTSTLAKCIATVLLVASAFEMNRYLERLPAPVMQLENLLTHVQGQGKQGSRPMAILLPVTA